MTTNPDALARKRFFALSSMRVVGAILVLAGFGLIRGAWAVAGQPADRWVGVAVGFFGLFDFAIIPKILARSWRSPTASLRALGKRRRQSVRPVATRQPVGCGKRV